MAKTRTAAAPAQPTAPDAPKRTRLRIVYSLKQPDGTLTAPTVLGYHWLAKSGKCSQLADARSLGALLQLLPDNALVTIFHD